MTPQSLKSAILQLAIQGKLVPQRPEEGSAAPLLRPPKSSPPRTPKSSLPRSLESSVPSPPFPPGTEPPFDIPESWRWVRLGDVVFNHGQKKPTGDFSYIDIGSIDNKNQRLADNETIVRPANASPRARKIVHRGDIIYSTVRPYLHNVCVIDREFSHEPIASTGFAVMACADCLDNRFLFYFLLSPDFDRYANSSENAKGVAYPAISDKRLYNAPFPLPPLPEQRRIVAKIEELLPQIDRYEQAWIQLEDFNRRFPADMQKSLLQLAIQGKLVEQRPEEGTAQVPAAPNTEKKKARRHGEEFKPPFEIPESWEWVRLADISDSINVGIVIRPKRYYVSHDEGTPAFRNCNIQQGFIDDGEWVYLNPAAALENPRAVVKTGDVLVARSGTPGNCCVVTEPYSGRGAVDIVIVRLQQKLVKPDYIKAFLCSPFTQKTFLSMSRGVALSHLGAMAVASLTVPLPPLAEQKRIVAKLEELLPLCARLK